MRASVPIRKVAVLIDREQTVAGDPELRSQAARRHAPMEYHLARTLRRLRYTVALIPCYSGRQLIRALGEFKPDVVYNATEHMNGRRADDIQIPALLEMLHLPYTGASAASLLVCRDKAVSKSLAAMAGVRVPQFALAAIGNGRPHDVPPFPVVVKPVSGDSSEGVSLRSIARTQKSLEERVDVVHRRFAQSAIIESFIAGTDLYVFAMQGKTIRILPPQQLIVEGNGCSPHSMATYHLKHNDGYRRRWRAHVEVAEIGERPQREIAESIRKLWPVLQLRDYARFDFRMTEEGEIYFIEANPNPGFCPGGRYDRWPDDEYAAAVKTLLSRAVRRSE